ncbi:tetratricopeptide repeat protein [Okeania sp. SIO1I7]|uniref:tetratricopeptide repeat protein n=1 Tax=Okeania sp. SIO1I7 TaxID=2607772 RepID=UPI0013F7272F|nr:tetratricopeptide repeat protein [Okeania sp. SIO1I7]NET28231.1 tetratricopeptide repeat protein [Okeania sp. SIO1I7]
MENQTSENIFNSAKKNYQKGNLKLAAKICHKILERDGENSRSLHLLGVIAGVEGQPKEAISYLTQAVQLNPNNPEIHSNLGLALKDNQQVETAIKHYQKAIELKLNYAEPYNGLGNIFLEQGKFAAAITHYQKAIELKLNYAEPYNGLGKIFLELGRLVESQKYYQQALKLDKNHANAHFGLAVILLKQGNFIQGFSEYEWRWQKKGFRTRNFSQPLWDGSSFQGKTLLVYTEQGLGDSIQFIRYIYLVKKLGGRVIVELNQAGLKLLFSTISGIDKLFVIGEKLPDFDLQIPLMSLPRIFGTTLETIPAKIPYLSIPKSTHFQIPPAPEKNLKVGICWQTSSNTKTSKKRSCPVQYLEEILSIGKANFYILQKEVLPADLEWLNSQTQIHNLGSFFNDLADTATVIQQLDLVITIDTVICHLAGALGKPVWVILNFDSDWRWMLDRNDSPWYPTARLFRQTKIGDWDSLFIEVKQALIELL